MTSQAQQKRILVFAEQGADSRTLCKALHEIFTKAAAPVAIIPVTAAQMRAPGMMDPQQTLGFVLPGASDAGYDRKLGPDNIKALRNFVEQGGRFLGICAGAYYACRAIKWYGWDPARTKRKTPGIDFFNYAAHGPIRELIATQDIKEPQDRSLSHCALADITWHDGKYNRRTNVMYWGGPHFKMPDYIADPKNTPRILARFNNVAGNPPAIMMATIGKGTALISSVHPEIRGAEFERAVYGHTDLHQRARSIARIIEGHETGRAALWRNLAHRLFPEYIR